MSTILLMGLTAHAGEPTVAAHAQGGVGTADRAAGVSGAVGWTLGERLALEAVVEADSGSDGLGLRTRGEVRWSLTDAPWSAAVLAGGGASVLGGVTPQLAVGVAMQGPQRRSLSPRLQARYLLGTDLSPQVMLVDVGMVWGRQAEPMPAVVEAEPVPVNTVDLNQRISEPDDLLVWVPHPICEWRPAAEAESLLASLPADQAVQLSAAGFLPQTIELDGEDTITLQPAPPQGAVVVAAGGGDQITVQIGEEEPLIVSDLGPGVVALPPGDATVRIEGAGRIEAHEVAVFDGYVIWLQAGEVTPELIGFSAGSSSLSSEQRRQVQAKGEQAGGWSYTIQGSASPEGDAAVNRRLAEARADAVQGALLATGLDASRIQMLPVALPESGTLEEMRSVTISPVLEPGS